MKNTSVKKVVDGEVLKNVKKTKETKQVKKKDNLKREPNRKSPCKVSFWLTNEELEKLIDICEKLDVNRSEFFRSVINNKHAGMQVAKVSKPRRKTTKKE